MREKADALADLRKAREAYRAEVLDRPPAEVGAPPFVFTPRRERFLFQQARRALHGDAQLDAETHASLLEEVQRVKALPNAEPIPEDVLAYLDRRNGRGRPRRLSTAKKARDAVHITWLLWGYYKRRKNRPALDQAKAAAAVIVSTRIESVRDWWKVAHPPCW